MARSQPSMQPAWVCAVHIAVALVAGATAHARVDGDLCPPATGDCCELSGNPGCADPVCCEAVCEVDPFCCTVRWDAICASEAQFLCDCPKVPIECGRSPNDCCVVSSQFTPSCSDQACCELVCSMDPLCCTEAWDQSCAGDAFDLCGICDGDCGTTEHDCWTAGAAGCSDEECCESVCAFDSTCCTSTWDAWCVWAAMSVCGTPPGVCGGAGHGPFEMGAPGCDDIACCDSVCGGEPDCCTIEWDATCIWLAEHWCGPPLGACAASTHDCLTQGEGGCNDEICCEAVCVSDPSCCSTAWDGGCVQWALSVCDAPECSIVMPRGARLEQEICGEDTNGGCTPLPHGDSSCCFPNGTWYCDDWVCFNAVWEFDPFCVCIAWDAICATEAAILCPTICTLGPVAFEPIECGDIVYGSLWLGENDLHDTDWYAFTLVRRTLVTVTVEAGRAIRFGIAETDGVPDCALATEIDPVATTDACEAGSVSRCLEPGTHWIKIEPWDYVTSLCTQWRAPYVLTLDCSGRGCTPPDPINDTCELATPISVGETQIDSTDASSSGDVIPGCLFSMLSKDLWFTFEPPHDGLVRIGTCNGAYGIDGLTLATGTCGALTAVACADFSSDCPLGGAALEAYVEEGTTYHLRVGSSQQGEGTLSIAYLGCDGAPYSVVTLEPYAGLSKAGGINEAGVMCGRHVGKAFTWSPTAGFTQITGGLQVKTPRDLNDVGLVVGEMQVNTSMPLFPFVATNHVAATLALPAGSTSGSALAVNNAGTIVGEGSWPQRAVRWIGGVPEHLVLPLGPLSSARDINAAGDICGFMGGSSSTPGERHGYVLSGNTVIDIVPPPNMSSEANAINDVGQVAGFLRLPDPDGSGTVTRGFVWKDGVYSMLEPLPGFVSTSAMAINDAGTVLATMKTAGGSTLHALWKGSSVIPISELAAFAPDAYVWSLVGINNAGEISALMVKTPLTGGTSDSVGLLMPNPLSADLDCDGVVDGVDLAAVLGAWGPCAPFVPCGADIDHDGVVDAADLAILLGAWGTRP